MSIPVQKLPETKSGHAFTQRIMHAVDYHQEKLDFILILSYLSASVFIINNQMRTRAILISLLAIIGIVATAQRPTSN